MIDPNEEQPLLPPKPRDGIERGVQWIFTGILVLVLFVLVIVGIQFAERAANDLPVTNTNERPETIDIGATADE